MDHDMRDETEAFKESNGRNLSSSKSGSLYSGLGKKHVVIRTSSAFSGPGPRNSRDSTISEIDV